MKPGRFRPLGLRQIEVFRAVMVARSISGAAQLLHVSQPAVSRLLSHTEACLGYPLFERVKGRLYATPEAERLFAQVQSVYAGLQRVNEAARDFFEHRGGVLRLVSHSTIGQSFLPEAIAAFHAAHADVKLTFECLRQAVLQERLLGEDTDLAITIFPVEHPSLSALPLCQAALVCVMPPGHPLAARSEVRAQDLQAHPLITYARSSPFGQLLDQLFEATEEPPSTNIEVGSPQNAAALASAGVGIALMDEFSAHEAARMGLELRPVAGAPLFQATVVHRRYQPMSQASHAFVSVLQDLVRKHGYRPA